MDPDKYEAVVRKKVAKFKAHTSRRFSSVGFTHGQLTRRAFLKNFHPSFPSLCFLLVSWLIFLAS